MKTDIIAYLLEACLLLVLMRFLTCLPATSNSLSSRGELKLEPQEALISSGETVTFLCSSPSNTTFRWNINDVTYPYRTTKGVSFYNETNGVYYWSKLTLVSVKRIASGEITCISGDGSFAVAFLIVNGVPIGGSCSSADDCITDKAMCDQGICKCPRSEVLLRLTKSGYEVCRQMIHRLYDPCEFSEQCFHLVDSKSVCSSAGVCVCAAWATDSNGKCVSKGEVSYNKNQELYRVGLVAITCLIIVIVAVSLWVTLRKSCQEDMANQRRTMSQNGESDRANEVIMEISEDKPPSYEEVRETGDTVGSPPNFKDALKHSMTAKKLLRQVSAPAGQLLPETTFTPTKANLKKGS